MSDEAIPDDVMKVARKVWLKVRRPELTGVLPTQAIARAILAERARCAKIVEALPLTELHRWGVDTDNNPKLAWQLGAETQRTAITYAIRSSS